MLHDYGKLTLPKHTFGILAIPATLYIGLWTNAPVSTDDGTTIASDEPASANGYARQAYTTAAGWAVDVPTKVVYNVNQITFPTDTTADWGWCYGYFIADALTAGNVYLSQPFDTSGVEQVIVGTQLIVPAGGITFDFTNPA